MDLFWSKNWQFLLKNLVFRCFLENRPSEFHVTWPERLVNCFVSFSVSVLSGKILDLAILAFLVKNTLLLVPNWAFRSFLAIVFQSVDVFWPFLLFKLISSFKKGKASLSFGKEKLSLSGPFLVQNLAVFVRKSGF